MDAHEHDFLLTLLSQMVRGDVTSGVHDAPTAKGGTVL